MTTLELSELLASGAPEWLLIVAALLLLTRVVAAVLDGLPKLLDALNRRAATRAALRPDAHADLRAAALAVLDVHDDNAPPTLPTESPASPERSHWWSRYW
ncbi:MAG: hypothetical protein LC799_14090 [Actinobacteria bacterium]|nr:hypothetical protein [Actinomycetota bacterium]